MSPTDALVELLIELFDEKDLRKFVAAYRHGKTILEKIPKKAQSEFDLAYYIVKAWSQKGLLDEALRDRLKAAHPKQGREIREVFDELLEDQDYLDDLAAAKDDDDDDDDDDDFDEDDEDLDGDLEDDELPDGLDDDFDDDEDEEFDGEGEEEADEDW